MVAVITVANENVTCIKVLSVNAKVKRWELTEVKQKLQRPLKVLANLTLIKRRGTEYQLQDQKLNSQY